MALVLSRLKHAQKSNVLMLIFPRAGTGRHVPLCMAGACVGIVKPGAFLRRGGSSGSSLGPALNLAAVVVHAVFAT